MPEELIENNMIFLQTKKEIIIEDRESQEWIYLASYYNAENNVAQSLIALNEYKNVKKIDNFAKKLKKIENSTNLELSEKQKEAVEAIQKHNVCVITGGPRNRKNYHHKNNY